MEDKGHINEILHHHGHFSQEGVHKGVLRLDSPEGVFFLKNGYDLNKSIRYSKRDDAEKYVAMCQDARSENIFHPDSMFDVYELANIYSVKALIPELEAKARWGELFSLSSYDAKLATLKEIVYSYNKGVSKDIWMPFNWGVKDNDCFYYDLHLTNDFEH